MDLLCPAVPTVPATIGATLGIGLLIHVKTGGAPGANITVTARYG